MSWGYRAQSQPGYFAPLIFRSTILAIACLLGSQVHAQTDPLRWRFSTELVQDMLLSFNARVYKVSGRWSYGAHGGYRPSISSGGEVKGGLGRWTDYEDLNWRNWMLHAYTIGPCVRMNFKGSTDNYVEIDGFYRHWWFRYKDVRYSNADDVSFDGFRSEQTDVLAVRLLWGTAATPKFKEGRNSANVLEFFGGVGYRWKTGSWTMHNGTYQGDPAYELTGTMEKDLPTLHFGIRLTRVIRVPREQQ